jgi:carboxypeptidase Taq
MRELAELRRAAALLSWDQQVMMPPAGADGRARALGTLRVIAHRRLVDPRLGELLEEQAAGDLDRPRAAMVRVLRHERDRAVRLPDDLVRRIAVAGSRGQAVWQAARAADDWEAFRPALEEVVALKREQAGLLAPDGEPYDALLDGYEPGMRTVQVEAAFAPYAEELGRLIEAIRDARPLRPPPFAGTEFPQAGQWDLTMRILRDIGFDFAAGRQDISAHPFTTTIALRDVRVTTRFHLDAPLDGIFASLHEAGHGLYDQGYDPEWEDTPVAHAPSLGLHESQSRLWENLIGRSLPFWRRYVPAMHELFGERIMAGADADDLHRAANTVAPSFIRVEADEVTYGMHVLIRFELELGLVRGTLPVADLPEAWNEAYRRRLGIVPRTYAEGVMQDVHWSTGAIGYFPTYSIGTMYSVILWNRLVQDVPGVDGLIESGEFAPILGWLREHVHRPGSLEDGDDLIHGITGKRLDHAPLVDYLWRKYGALYGVRR